MRALRKQDGEIRLKAASAGLSACPARRIVYLRCSAKVTLGWLALGRFPTAINLAPTIPPEGLAGAFSIGEGHYLIWNIRRLGREEVNKRGGCKARQGDCPKHQNDTPRYAHATHGMLGGPLLFPVQSGAVPNSEPFVLIYRNNCPNLGNYALDIPELKP